MRTMMVEDEEASSSSSGSGDGAWPGSPPRPRCAKCSRQKGGLMVRSFLLGSLKAIPFFLLVQKLSQLHGKSLQPCNKQGDCTFIRYWGTKDLPRSARGNDPKCNSAGEGESECNDMYSNLAVFMSITNGIPEVEFSHPGWYQEMMRFCTNTVLWASDVFLRMGPVEQNKTLFLPAMCPDQSTEEDMQGLCDSQDMKDRAASEGNHLVQAISLKVYLYSTVLWALGRVIHDWLVITDETPEIVTLTVGYAALLAQIIALTSGFLWSIGAAEVFVAIVQDSAGQNLCGCYYRMDTLQMFGLILSPVTLYMMTRNKLWYMFYAVLHGDYLYGVDYSIPYRAVVRFNSDPGYSFLQLHHSIGEYDDDVSRRQFTCREFQWMSYVTTYITNFFVLCTLLAIYAFAIPALTVRFYGLITHSFPTIGTWLFFSFALFAPLWAILQQYLKGCYWIDWIRRQFTADGEGIGQRMKKTGHSLWYLIYYLGYPVFRHLVEIVVFTFWAQMSLWYLPWFLMQRKQIGPENAGIVGAAGFYLFVSFLNVFIPSETPLWMLKEAVQMRGGQSVPVQGFDLLRQMDDHFPHLALQPVRACADKFMKQNPESALNHSGLGLAPEEELQKWIEFATNELDNGKEDRAPPRGPGPVPALPRDTSITSTSSRPR